MSNVPSIWSLALNPKHPKPWETLSIRKNQQLTRTQTTRWEFRCTRTLNLGLCCTGFSPDLTQIISIIDSEFREEIRANFEATTMLLLHLLSGGWWMGIFTSLNSCFKFIHSLWSFMQEEDKTQQLAYCPAIITKAMMAVPKETVPWCSTHGKKIYPSFQSCYLLHCKLQDSSTIFIATGTNPPNQPNLDLMHKLSLNCMTVNYYTENRLWKLETRNGNSTKNS